MRTFAFDPELLRSRCVPGTWRHWIYMRDVPTVAIICPGCGRALCLPKHRIDPDGRVRPSVVCTHTGCNFHEFIRLAGYTPPEPGPVV